MVKILLQNKKADDLETWYAAVQFVQMMTLDWPWPILRPGKILPHMLLYGEKSKTKDISETIVVCDIKVGRCTASDAIN